MGSTFPDSRMSTSAQGRIRTRGQELRVSCCGNRKSEVKVWAGFPLSRRSLRRASAASRAGGVFGVPWVVDTSPPSLPLSSQGICGCLHISSFIKGTVTLD